ncbi:MAG: DUF1924 domain-containing protein [Magnetococcus sp. WYHC-3]
MKIFHDVNPPLIALLATGLLALALPCLARADDAVARGRELWLRPGLSDANGTVRRCTTCHGADPRLPGRHERTGKIIQAMAPSRTPTRFSDAAHTEKWFLRNCEWTFGRECSPEEKTAVLAYLRDCR